MSSNQQILSVVGQVVGSYFGPVGAAIGGGIGSYLGASLDQLPDAIGPRLEDRKLLTSSFGTPIPFAYGSNRISGNVIWLLGDALTETASTDDTGGKSGQPAQSTTIYTYSATFALLLSQTPSRSVRRIWAGAMLIYDGGLIDSVLPDFNLTFYRGSEDQLPDPLIEAEKGVDLTPAYRGYSYLVFDAMPVEKTGWPCNFTVELVSDGEFEIEEEALGIESPDEDWKASTQRLDGNIIAAQQFAGSPAFLRLAVLDQQTGMVLSYVDHADMSTDLGEDSSVCYVPPLNQVWVAGNDDNVLRFDATTLEYLGDFFNGAMSGGSSRMVWDAVRQRVFHRPNAQWLRAGGQNVLLAGAVSVTDIINAERCGYIGLDYALGFEAMDAIVGSVPGHGYAPCSAAYDPMRRRYVVFNSDDDLYTATDSTSPVVTLVASSVVSDFINAAVFYDASTDCVVKIGVVVGITAINIFDAETFEIKATLNDVVDPDRLRLGIVDAYPDTTTTGRVFVVGVYQPWAFNYFGTTVGACVRDLSERSGLDASDVDVGDLTQTLRGYLVSNVGDVRPAVQQLAQVYSFVGVEEDDVLRFKLRGADPVAVIERIECGATEDGSQIPSITKVRAQQLDLPSRYSVTAPDPQRDYQAGTQFSQRQAASAGQVAKFQTAAVLNADEQVRLSNLLMYDAWVARNAISFSTDKRFTRVMPGDVVTLDGERVLIVSRDTSAGVIKWEGISDDASVLTQYGIGVIGDFPDQIPPITVPTYDILMDMALLRDADDHAGAYEAVWGVAPYWRGAVLYRSADSGVSWTRAATATRPGASVGTALNALGNWTGGNVFDEVNSLTVRMRNGTPTSTTRDGVLAGNNAAAVRSGDGWEVIQYRTATLNGDGTYTLSGLLRGRRGTDWATDGHAVDDDVVLLELAKLRDILITNSEIGVEELAKAVSIGATLSDTESEAQTIFAERLVPWNPVDLRGLREVGSDDVTLTWKRRTRLAARFTGALGINVPLGEASEVYDLEILFPGTAEIARMLSGLTSAEYLYTAADQVTDGYAPTDHICVRIYQVSATMGRGHPFEACTGVGGSAGDGGGDGYVIYVPGTPVTIAAWWEFRFWHNRLAVPNPAAIQLDFINLGNTVDPIRPGDVYPGDVDPPPEYGYIVPPDSEVLTAEFPPVGGSNGDVTVSSRYPAPWTYPELAFSSISDGVWQSTYLDVDEGGVSIIGFNQTVDAGDGTVSGDPAYTLIRSGKLIQAPRNWDLIAWVPDGDSPESLIPKTIHRVREYTWPTGLDHAVAFDVHHGDGIRFWRLLVKRIEADTLGPSSRRIQIKRLEMFTVSGGPDVCYEFAGDGYADDAYITAYAGNKAFGETATGWWCRIGAGFDSDYEPPDQEPSGYLLQPALEFAFVNPTDVVEYAITNASSHLQAPYKWVFQASVDGVTWTTVDERDGEIFTANQRRVFTLPKTVVFGDPP